MKELPRYTKVLNLGSQGTERALMGEVVCQEKIDGSQFRFGLNEEGEMLIGSKSVNWEYGHCEAMFKKGANYIRSIEGRIKDTFDPDTYFYCEYLQKQQHNVLAYDKTPKNHLILFDSYVTGGWVMDRPQLEWTAKALDIDVVPELFRGTIEMKRIGTDKTKGWTGLDFLKNMIYQTMSILGGQQIEGVVIKNYGETMLLYGQVFPVFTKYVREEYREQHRSHWKIESPKTALQDYFAGFANESRWDKAIIHLKEKGLFTNSVKDIGLLIKEIQSDIREEEQENIKEFLYKKFIDDVCRASIKGFVDWYKDKLINDNLTG